MMEEGDGGEARDRESRLYGRVRSRYLVALERIWVGGRLASRMGHVESFVVPTLIACRVPIACLSPHNTYLVA